MKQIFFVLLIVLMIQANSCKIDIKEKAVAQTAGNDPTIKKGQTFLYSKSQIPKQFDFICFLGELPGHSEKYLMLYRLCGMAGDTVQIKEGDFYLNGKLIDKQFSLKHNYYIARKDFEPIKDSIPIDDNSKDLAADTLIIAIDDAFVQKHRLNAKRQVLSPTFRDESIRGKFSQDWNLDNFGPAVVPKDAYFVLGDNRHVAWDSRYRGFINRSDFLGTVLMDK